MPNHSLTAQLHAELADARATSSTRAYSSVLRRRVVHYAQDRRREGLSWKHLADRLGLSTTTVYRWAQALNTSPTADFLPVTLSDAPLTASTLEHNGLILVAPSGFRLERLSLAQAM